MVNINMSNIDPKYFTLANYLLEKNYFTDVSLMDLAERLQKQAIKKEIEKKRLEAIKLGSEIATGNKRKETEEVPDGVNVTVLDSRL